jgi:hypothetical protein
MVEAILIDVDVKLVCVTAPATEKLDLVVLTPGCGCG